MRRNHCEDGRDSVGLSKGRCVFVAGGRALGHLRQSGASAIVDYSWCDSRSTSIFSNAVERLLSIAWESSNSYARALHRVSLRRLNWLGKISREAKISTQCPKAHQPLAQTPIHTNNHKPSLYHLSQHFTMGFLDFVNDAGMTRTDLTALRREGAHD